MTDITHQTRLNPALRLPLYAQIGVILRGRIVDGSVRPGDRLPGEAEVAAEFGVSRITAKRALNDLAEAGLVRREQGRGTIVLDRPTHPSVRASIEGWLENAWHMGRVTTVRVLDFGYVPAGPAEAAAMGVDPGTVVQRAVRVRLSGGRPMSHLVTHVPRDIGESFGADDLGAQPMLALLERAGVQVSSARQTITATLADPEVAGALDLPVGAALTEVRRVVRDAGGRVVECIRVLYRPDAYTIGMTMRRVRGEGGMVWATGDDVLGAPEGQGW